MPFQNQAGLGVNNFYGARDTGTSVGVEQSSDGIHQLSIAFTGDSLQDAYMPPYFILKGALFKRAVLRVDEAFNITGTTPTIIFGSTGSEATNGFVLTEAELETVGTKTPASTGLGTWSQTSSTGVLANAKVGRVLGGTTPAVVKGVGKATLILEFFYKTKV
jgi:hypothetical protein